MSNLIPKARRVDPPVVPTEALQEARDRVSGMVTDRLSDLVRQSGLSRRQLAARLGKRDAGAGLARTLRGDDTRLSTLSDLAVALGGHLQVTFLPGEDLTEALRDLVLFE